MRYKSVGPTVCDMFCKMQVSFIVFKIPPKALNALLENRKGVAPGTTSTASHNGLDSSR